MCLYPNALYIQPRGHVITWDLNTIQYKHDKLWIPVTTIKHGAKRQKVELYTLSERVNISMCLIKHHIYNLKKN